MSTQWSGGLLWSFSSKGIIVLIAPMRDGRMLLRHELVFTGLSPEELAPIYRAKLREWQIASVSSLSADPEIFPKAHARGETVSESLRRLRLPVRKGDPDRLAGWMRLRAWLQLLPRQGSPRLTPSLIVHPDCVYTIRTLPVLVQDPANLDDVSAQIEEYPARALALWAMSRPAPLAEPVKPPPGPNTWGYHLKDVFAPPKKGILGSDLVDKR